MLFDADLLEHVRLISRSGRDHVSSDEDRILRDLLLMHPEFDSLWNNPQVDPVRPQEIEGVTVNPFVHIALHLIIGNQVRQGSPAQVKKAYLHLVERGETDHDALHRIMGWYGKLYFESARDRKSVV